jgi:hypothetical protein
MGLPRGIFSLEGLRADDVGDAESGRDNRGAGDLEESVVFMK